MADALTIQFNGLEELSKWLSTMEKRMIEDIDGVMNVIATDIELDAKQNAPIDEGLLARSISADNSKLLEKHITVNAFYAAFVEFGTGKYAAEYVASLPQDWQTFASQFRGDEGKRTIAGLLFILKRWFEMHGIEKDHAYLIARKIFLNGTKPHPFLFPAFQKGADNLAKNIQTVLNEL